MILANIRMRISPRKRDEALRILRSTAEGNRVLPGCLSCRIYEDFQEDNMIRINSPNRINNPLIIWHDPLFTGIGWFIDRIIASNPWIVLIATSKCLPKVYDPVLEMFLIPEEGFMGGII